MIFNNWKTKEIYRKMISIRDIKMSKILKIRSAKKKILYPINKKYLNKREIN